MEDAQDGNTIFGFSETWFNEENSKNEWTFDKNLLSCFRKDRSIASNKSKGGGIQLLIPSKFNPFERRDLESKSSIFEIITVEIDSPTGSLHPRTNLCLVYSPHKNHREALIDTLDPILSLISLENKHVMIMGDFNINLFSELESAP
jgi:hypothetical protein